MGIQILVMVLMNLLIILPALICYYIVKKTYSNNLFIRTLKIYVTIVAIEKVIYIFVQVFMMLYWHKQTAVIQIVTKFITIINSIIIPASIIGVLILLFGLASIEERGDKYD